MCLFQKGHATVVPFTMICALVIQLHNKKFLVLRSNYTTKVCLELYELFISKMGLKCSCLVDFFITSLPTMRAYTHAHCCSLLKTRECEVASEQYHISIPLLYGMFQSTEQPN